MDLKKDVKYVKGVGPNRVTLLNKLGIYTIQDLITHYPREHEDRSKPKSIIEVIDGEETLIKGIVIEPISETKIRKKMLISKLKVRDETGICIMTWFNQVYLKNQFQVGKTYQFYGKISKQYGRTEMNSPVFDSENMQRNTGKIIPIYPTTYSLSQNTIRHIIENALIEVKGKLEETLPDYLIKEYKLLDLNTAIEQIHFPQNKEMFEKARKRFVFEELLTMQMALIALKHKIVKEEKGIAFPKEIKISHAIQKLPFKLTNAQNRALEEIDHDMEQERPMNRLLQGDVGAGKTVIAMLAAYKAVKSGYQAAIMAPTAILASQHLESFESLFRDLNIKCELLIGSVTKKKKEEILEKLRNGQIDILIGTHAILEENVIFSKLGLVVTDEQHRFGVRQRSTIAEKGVEISPDVLVMTATPIPRTLALILYGDLDISIMDELPPNRKKIDTFPVTKSMEERVNRFIKKQLQEGRQAYIVCPLVEENEEIKVKDVVSLTLKYKTEVLQGYRVEAIHGKMRPKEKDQIMQDFKDKKIDVLVSTTVIEVGVNVPNASLMIVENAERFGLAQLHQLRGRVGRGEYQSYCILKYEGNSDIIRQRMKIMHDTNDGFQIAQKDLELRGTGEFFGTKQHGLPEFKIANLFEDMVMLKQVQSVALKIEQDDPKLQQEKNNRLRKEIEEKFKHRLEL